MKKRQLKKFAKNAKKQMSVYRAAPTKGSKKLRRRWKCMCRYWPGGGARAEKSRMLTMRLREFEKRVELLPRSDAVSRLAGGQRMGPEEAYAELGALITEWTLSIPTSEEELGAASASATK